MDSSAWNQRLIGYEGWDERCLNCRFNKNGKWVALLPNDSLVGVFVNKKYITSAVVFMFFSIYSLNQSLGLIFFVKITWFTIMDPIDMCGYVRVWILWAPSQPKLLK